MWSSNFLVEVAVKVGVLLAVPRCEARKNPRNLASCSTLTYTFNAKTFTRKENGWLKLIEVISTLSHPPFLYLDLQV